MQSLQLLGLCDGMPLEHMTSLLGEKALSIIIDSGDAVQAALALTPEMLSILHPQASASRSILVFVSTAHHFP